MDSHTSDPTPLKEREHNIPAARRHRREFWWQILVPLLIFLVILGLGINAVLGQDAGSIGAISQISTILLLLPVIFLGLVLFILVIALTYMLGIALQWIPPNAYWLQKQIQRVNFRIKEISNLAAEPVLMLDSWAEAAGRLFRRFQQ